MLLSSRNTIKQEQELYKAIFHRRTQPSDILHEVTEVKRNAKMVKANSIPHITILIFSSNNNRTGFNHAQ